MPRRTVRRHRDGVVRLPGKEHSGSTSPVSTGEYEDGLVVYIHEMEKAMYGLTMTNVRRLTYNLAERASLIHRFDRNNLLACWEGMVVRIHEASLGSDNKVPNFYQPGKNERFQPEGGNFFCIYRGVLETGEFGPLKIGNCNETGFSTVTKPGKFLYTKGK